MRIGIDLMGSDTSPIPLFDAIQESSKLFPHCYFTVLLTQNLLDQILADSANIPHFSDKIEYRVFDQVIKMTDHPLTAFREKKRSTLVQGLSLLKDCYLDAFISSANTGALVASASLMLPHIKGIKRPALLVNLPTIRGHVAVLDVGGTVAAKSMHMIQYATLGALFQRFNQSIERPRVGLLNIGIESKKGTEVLRETYEHLALHADKMNIVFAGNVEGRDVFEGVVDVVVTDGFSGNIFLKTAEGVVKFVLARYFQLIEHEGVSEDIADYRDNVQNRDNYCKGHGHDAQMYSKLVQSLGGEQFGGAILAGLGGLVIKCHGSISREGMRVTIHQTIRLVENGYVARFTMQDTW